MITQGHKHIKQIEEFLIKNDSLIDVIKMEDVTIKNRIVMALDDITNTSVSDYIKDRAKEQIDRITTIGL
jgi:hypothetical protein